MKKEFVASHIDTVQRCVARCEQTRTRSADAHPDLFDRMDILTMNLIRLAEALIDLAKHMVKSEGLGVVKNARDAFIQVAPVLPITIEEANQLSNMVGFRNLAVHNYATIQDDAIEMIVKNSLDLPLRVALLIGKRAGL